MDFASAFPGPFSLPVGGVDVVFTLLTSREFASYAQKLRDDEWQRELAHQKTLPVNLRLDAVQMYRVRQEIDHVPRSIGDLVRAAGTGEGADFYLVKSLLKAGYPEPQAVAIVELLDPMEKLDLSMAVTRVNKLPKKSKPAKPFSDPLSVGAGTGIPAPTPTPAS